MEETLALTADAAAQTSPRPTDLTGQRLRRLIDRFEASPRLRYWTLQIAGWIGLCVITFTSLTLWYNSVAAAYIVHTVVQAALGLMISHGMRIAFRRLWRVPIAPRLVLVSATVAVASFSWTLLRIQTFMGLTGEVGVWSDFGGWLFASLLVMISWTLAYHGAKFFEQMTRERERAIRARAVASQERLRRVTAEANAQDAQLRMLRYQINPHFLFNTLNSVSALIQTERGEDAAAMIGELSRFLRKTLREDVPLRTALSDEIDMLRLYLGIEQKRFRERLHVTYDVGREAAGMRVPSLLLQPVVENSIKYAVARHSGTTRLRLTARVDGERLCLRVEDTGSAPSSPTAAGERGIGLANVRERLLAEYGEAASVRSAPVGDEDADTGWRTVIVLPAEPMNRTPEELDASVPVDRADHPHARRGLDHSA